MVITIGTTLDDRRKLTKSFSGTSITVQLKAPCDILHPVFILSYSAAYCTANYLYCPDFNRYYFINNMQVLTGNRIEISCVVDVLMSYNNAIKGLTCNIVRQESKQDKYVSDSSMPLRSSTELNVYNFDRDPFSVNDVGFNYVLTVAGG